MIDLSPLVTAVATTVDVTPHWPVSLGCAPKRDTPFVAVREPLECNVLVLAGEPTTTPTVILSIDALYAGRRLVSSVQEACGLPRTSDVLCFATHTHRAPMLDPSKPLLGKPDEQHVTRVVSAVAEAARNLIHESGSAPPVRVKSASGVAKHSINRRLPHEGQIRLAPYPDGPTDETVQVVVFEKAPRKPIAALWSYACHPVGDPEIAAVAAHFPHVVRTMIRDHLRIPDLPVLFVQGFSGDTRPSVTAYPRSIRDRARRILNGPRFFDMSSRTYTSWASSLGDVVMSVLDGVAETNGVPGPRTRHAEVPLARIAQADRPLLGSLELKMCELAPGLQLVGVSAEMVCEYGHWLRACYPERDLILGGCMSDPFGYVPTNAMLGEGGYEAAGYLKSFGLTGINPDIEDVVKSAFANVLE